MAYPLTWILLLRQKNAPNMKWVFSIWFIWDWANNPSAMTSKISLQQDPLIYADAIKARGDTKIFVVGVTDDVDANELRDISSPPQIEGQTWWRAADFNALADFYETLLGETCVKTCKPQKRTSESIGNSHQSNFFIREKLNP